MIIDPNIEQYMSQYQAINEPIIEEMGVYAREHDFPYIGPQVGSLLYQYTLLTGAKNILELGSGFGYSAAWFFMATLTAGKITCTEMSEENITLGRDFLTRLGAVGNVSWKLGDALETIESLDEEFAIILIDIEKADYPRAFKKALPKLKTGGLLIADNAHWSGKVAETPPRSPLAKGEEMPDAETAGILEYNSLIHASKELVTTIIPIGDGVFVSLKI